MCRDNVIIFPMLFMTIYNQFFAVSGFCCDLVVATNVNKVRFLNSTLTHIVIFKDIFMFLFHKITHVRVFGCGCFLVVLANVTENARNLIRNIN